MTGEIKSNSRAGESRKSTGPALMIAGAVSVLALPSAVLAFSNRLDVPPPGFAANQGLGSFAPGQIDPRLARAIAARPQGKGALFRFTPAGLATRPDRSVTVAVRVDPQTAQTIIVRGATDLAARGSAAGLPALRIAPTAYNLGISRGYQGFTQSTQTFALSADKLDMPDLSTYRPADPGRGAAPAARLAPHISLDERERAGRAPRTLEGVGEQSVDLGGSYRLTRNLDVTAGVRYSEDRDRLKPLTDGKADSQAVFVGTQFHF